MVEDAQQIIRTAISGIEGFLSENEGTFLYNMAKNCKGDKGVIVEIGSWKGRSTICLGKGSIAGNKVKVYAIDPHRDTSTHKVFGTPHTFGEFKENIQAAGINEVVFPIMKTSAEAVKVFNQPVELLFIDGEHEYEMVRLDFELWYPKLAYGSFIVFHDRGFSGPREVINKYVYRSKHFKDIGIVDSLLFARKTRKNSISSRIINILLFLINISVILYYSIPIRKRPMNITSRILKGLKIMK